MKTENCLHGCFPENVVGEKGFLKTFFIDYIPAIVFLDNDDTTQVTRIIFVKRSLKTETGRGDLLKCIVDSRGQGEKIAK